MGESKHYLLSSPCKTGSLCLSICAREELSERASSCAYGSNSLMQIKKLPFAKSAKVQKVQSYFQFRLPAILPVKTVFKKHEYYSQ